MKKKIIIYSLLLTIAALFALVGLITVFNFIQAISQLAYVIVVAAIIFGLAFSLFYDMVGGYLKRKEKQKEEEEDDDDDDDDDNDDPELPVAHIGILRQKTCAADYEVINDEEKELTTEFFSLDERISKTEKMIKDNDYKGTDVAKLTLLFAQLNTMKRYFMLLAARMENMGIIKYNK